MVKSSLQRVIRKVPSVEAPAQSLRVQDLPWRAVANDNVVEGFASKFLRIGGKVLGHALFYANFLEFEGDTAHHSPIVDQPPEGKTVSQWLSEMEEMSRISVEIYALQQQIYVLDQQGQGHLAHPLRQKMDQFLAQSQTIMQGNGISVTSGALAMVASAGAASNQPTTSAASDKKLDPVDWKALAATGDGEQYVAAAKRRIRDVSAVVIAGIETGENPATILAWYLSVAQPDLTAIHASSKDLLMNDMAGEAWHNTRNHLAYFIPYSAMVLEDGNMTEIREFFSPPKSGLTDIVAKIIDRHKEKATFEVHGLDGIQISPTESPDSWAELIDNIVRNAAENPKVGQKTHILIYYDRGVLTLEDTGKGMSSTLLAAFLAGKRTHSGVVLNGDTANADENVGHGFGGRLIQKWAERVGAIANYVSQEGMGTKVALAPIQDPIFTPDPLAFVLRGQGDFEQFKYLLERMSADKRVTVLKKLSTIMLAVGNDLFPRIQVAVDPDARKPGDPVPKLETLKQELGGVIQRYLRFFNIVATGTTMLAYEDVAARCRQEVRALVSMLHATSPEVSVVTVDSQRDEIAVHQALLLRVDKFIQDVYRSLAHRIDQEDYYLGIVEWYEKSVQPQLVHLQKVLELIPGTAQHRLTALHVLIPMYLKAGQIEAVRKICLPPSNHLTTMLDEIQARYGERVQITQIGTSGLRVATSVDHEKWKSILEELVRSAAEHPRRKGEVVQVTMDMSKGVLIFESNDAQDEHAESWDHVWQMGHELGIHVENEKNTASSIATLILPDGFLVPDPLQFVLGGRGDITVVRMMVDTMTLRQRQALLKEMDAIAKTLEDQALSQGLDALDNPKAPKPYLQELQHAAVRFEILATLLVEDLPDFVARAVRYEINHLHLVVRHPEGQF